MDHNNFLHREHSEKTQSTQKFILFFLCDLCLFSALSVVKLRLKQGTLLCLLAFFNGDCIVGVS